MEIDTEKKNSLSSDSLDKESQQELAGFNPNKPIELEDEYKLEQDTTSPKKPPVASQGMPRTMTILLITGGLIFGSMAIWTFIRPQEPTPSLVDRTTPEPEKEETVGDETARLKTQLALIEQDKMMKPAPSDEDLSESEESSEPTPEKQTPVKTTQPSPPPPRPAPPPPRPRPQPVVTRPTPPPQRAIAPLPPEPPELEETPPPPPPPPVDPYQKWQQLQALGFTQSPVTTSTVASTATISPDATSSNIQSTSSSIEQRSPEKPSSNTGNLIKTVTIGQRRSPAIPGVKEMTTGELGIINRRPTYTREDRPEKIHAIAFGTSTPGTVKVPLIWDEGSGEQLYNLFAIALDKPVQGTSGEVALPANTVIIAQAESLGRGNRLVQASAIALVYSDLTGNVKQEAIDPGAIIIRGEDSQPLIASGYHDYGNEIASQDLLIGLLSGLGEIGEVFTEPEQNSSFSSSSSSTGSNSSSNTTSSTIIRSRDPQIWSAVLKGFFNPLAERITSRNDEALNELLSRPNIAVIEKDTQVTVVVNSFLKINR